MAILGRGWNTRYVLGSAKIPTSHTPSSKYTPGAFSSTNATDLRPNCASARGTDCLL